MENKIKGIHHITAIAGDAKRNYKFYTEVLGLRFVKKTVNFDDPYTYHFYYGDEAGSPGTILTFFPWEGIMKGRRGTGMATEIGYAVPEGSFDFWLKRFEEHNVIYNKPSEKFEEKYLTFLDPDGLKLELIIPKEKDKRTQWTKGGIDENSALYGFYNATLTLNKASRTAEILTDVFGYKHTETHVNRSRYITDAVESASIIDLVEAPGEPTAVVAGGSVHHIAFTVKDRDVQEHFRAKLKEIGIAATQIIDRNYFYSVYFREPGGVLFELATEGPGMNVDEDIEELGTFLKLPPQYEARRTEIEERLPKLD